MLEIPVKILPFLCLNWWTPDDAVVVEMAPVFLAGFKTKYRLLIGVGEPFSTCPPSKQLLVSSKSVSNDVFVL